MGDQVSKWLVRGILRIKSVEKGYRATDNLDAALAALKCKWALEDVLEEYLNWTDELR